MATSCLHGLGSGMGEVSQAGRASRLRHLGRARDQQLAEEQSNLEGELRQLMAKPRASRLPSPLGTWAGEGDGGGPFQAPPTGCLRGYPLERLMGCGYGPHAGAQGRVSAHPLLAVRPWPGHSTSLCFQSGDRTHAYPISCSDSRAVSPDQLSLQVPWMEWLRAQCWGLRSWQSCLCPSLLWDGGALPLIWSFFHSFTHPSTHPSIHPSAGPRAGPPIHAHCQEPTADGQTLSLLSAKPSPTSSGGV